MEHEKFAKVGEYTVPVIVDEDGEEYAIGVEVKSYKGKDRADAIKLTSLKEAMEVIGKSAKVNTYVPEGFDDLVECILANVAAEKEKARSPHGKNEIMEKTAGVFGRTIECSTEKLLEAMKRYADDRYADLKESKFTVNFVAGNKRLRRKLKLPNLSERGIEVLAESRLTLAIEEPVRVVSVRKED